MGSHGLLWTLIVRETFCVDHTRGCRDIMDTRSQINIVLSTPLRMSVNPFLVSADDPTFTPAVTDFASLQYKLMD